MISAKTVADSICNGHRITTMKATMPRFILAEFNTHRMLSKNSASSRAIPARKMIQSVMDNPFVPIAWQKEHSGMQGTEYLDELSSQFCREIWLARRDMVVSGVESLLEQKATKQLANRLLEPWMWHTVLVTATEWENFFHLRCPQYQFTNSAGLVETRRSKKEVIKWRMNVDRWNRDVIEALENQSSIEWLQTNKGQAEIHMMALAEAMWDALNESTPKILKPGEWHMPYGDDIDLRQLEGPGEIPLEVHQELKLKIATAHCAQTSYTVVGEETSKTIDCPVCNGRGECQQTDVDWDECRNCSGTGKVTVIVPAKTSSYEVLLDVFGSLATRPYTNRKGKVFGPDDPVHMTPLEHCAQAMTEAEYNTSVRIRRDNDGRIVFDERGWCKNFRGWIQYRSMFPNENRR